MPLVARAQEESAPTPAESHVGMLRITGMAGFVSSVGPSHMELTLPEHATLAVHIASSTQITDDGQPASLSSIRPGSAVRVRGAFDLQAHTVEATAIDVLPPQESRQLELRSGNFLKRWTAGTVTDVQPDSVTLQRLDGEVQTIQVDGGTLYVHRGEPVGSSWLRNGERTLVQFLRILPNSLPLAGTINIQGMLPPQGVVPPQTLSAQEPTQQESVRPEVKPEQLSKPSCLHCPNPDFPDEARKAGITSARAVLEITVTEEGKADPDDIRVIDDPGYGFTKAAIAMVKKWKFNPAADKDGKAVKMRIPVEFSWHRWQRNP